MEILQIADQQKSEQGSPRKAPRPWVLVTIWLTVYLAIMGALVALRMIRPPGIYWWSWALATVQLVVGLWVRHRYYRTEIRLFSIDGWAWAILVLMSLQIIQYVAVVPRIGPAGGVVFALLELFKFLVLIGYTEELWFRGIWFAMFKNRMIPCVIVGSIAFGIVHIPHGIGSVLIASCVGCVFAAARYRGASILSLAVAHGIMDWLNNQMLPAKQLRVSMPIIMVILPVTCIALSILMLCLRRYKTVKNQDIM